MSEPSTPSQALISLVPSGVEDEWQPILQASNQVVLYNPKSHILTVSHASARSPPCPYCKQALPRGFQETFDGRASDESIMAQSQSSRELEDADHIDSLVSDPMQHTRTSDYFQLLAIANEAVSRPASPQPVLGPHARHTSNAGSAKTENGSGSRRSAFPPGTMAEGYFKAFFQEEYRLGMGANGSVFLCQHVLDGNLLGHFAVKKVAVGESHSYLLKILREVRLLERLHHPNIITYHHAWLESCQFSSFGPRVPTLHVLMQWAEGGSLDDFIDVRLGRKPAHVHINPLAPFTVFRASSSTTPSGSSANASPFGNGSTNQTLSKDLHSRSARIRSFRAFQRASPTERERMRQEMDMEYANQRSGGTSRQGAGWRAVHLLSADEVRSLFRDVVEGLAFLHDRSILHLDLKPGNVLLTWDEGKLIPRAMLSDFGTSRDMIHSSRASRSGYTGTLEYASPESLPSPHTGVLQEVDSKSDIWSLGMILHKMLFFKLPYKNAAVGDADLDNGSVELGASKRQETDKLQALEEEVLGYPGFKSTPAQIVAFEARRLPRTFLLLLESLLCKAPTGRPSVERVAIAIREGRLDPYIRSSDNDDDTSSMIARSTLNIGANEPDDMSKQPRLLESPASDSSPFVLSTIWTRIKQSRHAAQTLMRLGKSCLLVIKVISLSSLCENRPGTMPLHPLAAVLLGVAVVDTIWDSSSTSDGVRTSAALALFHFAVLRLCKSNILGAWCCW